MSPPAPEPSPDPLEAAALRAELERLRLLANSVAVGVAYYEAAGNTCVLANKVYATMFGLDERSVIGRTFAQVIGEQAAQRIQPVVDRVIAERRAQTYERELPGHDGTQHIEVTLGPHVDAAGTVAGAFVLVADITRHRRAEAALRKSEERVAKFMQASAEGIVFHKGGFITDVNPPLLQMLGYSLEEMMGRKTLDFVAPEERAKVASVIAAGAEITYDSVALTRDGGAIPVEFIVRTMQHQDTEQRMTIVRDRRDRVAAAARIYHLAHHDALTGLPNRALFDERVERLIAAGRQRRHSDPAGPDGSGFALLFVDLDHFKRVNDSLGHVVGDALLQTAARRIAATLRLDDLVARFGGDEFAVVLSGAPSRTDVLDVANKLLAAVGKAVLVLGSDISVTPSIGIAMYPEDGATSTELVKNADTAMYAAKRSGRATCCFFEPHMAEAAWAELAMEAQLAQAIRAQEFVVHYQPQLRQLADGSLQLAGLEALIRWRHPQRGLLDPAAFLKVAEARRQILAISQWVLSEALSQAMRWRAEGLLDVPVAVNLAMLQFQAPGFVPSIEATLLAAGAQGAHLELELTERMLLDEGSDAQLRLQQLKAMGVRLSIDDFGTGYSSLGHLRDLPIHRLKIDRSFIQDVPHDHGAAAIARAIIQLAHSLGLGVVAEGVETEAQRDWCIAQGCLEMQGYLLAKPMSVADAHAFLRTIKGPEAG